MGFNAFGIGTRHLIWVDPFCEDVLAEVVGYDARGGGPIVRTLDDLGLTLGPREYIFPGEDEFAIYFRVQEVFEEINGEVP